MNTITISDDIIEDVAQRIAAKLKVIDSDYISRKETLEQFKGYCIDNCRFSEQSREIMCSSCMMNDAKDIVDSM